MLLGVKKVEEPYQELLEKANEDDLEEIRDSPCLPKIERLETPKFSEKTMLRIKLNPLPKVSYQFIKHFLSSITHNGTVNRGWIICFHYVTNCLPINI